jgi:hypothetical protein
MQHVWKRGKVHTRFWWENLWKGDHMENPGIILKLIYKNWDGGGGGGIDWNDLAQDRDRWWALVNVVMNLWFT